MTEEALRAAIVETLIGIAPEIEPANVSAETDLRNDLDLDSMDFLNFVIGLHERFGVEIPESDYGRLETPSACARYLTEHGVTTG